MKRSSFTKFTFIAIVLAVVIFGFGEALRGTPDTNRLQGAATIAPHLAADSYLSDAERPVAAVKSSADTTRTTAQGSITDSHPAALFHTTNNEPAPSLDVRGALIADLETGETYFSVNPDRRWPMASVTKLMTAVYATMHTPKNEQVALTTAMISHLGDDTSATGLQAGESYSAEDLIRAMLTFSSNEAAEGLAEHDGRELFMSGLQAQADAWGLSNTTLVDPTGLSASNQSTPNELRTMLLRIYKEYPNLLAITRTPSVTLAEIASGKKSSYVNINQFAGRGDFIGGKTGYTDEASGNLVSLFAYENRPIAVIVLGTSDRFGATTALLDWFKRTHTSR